MRLGLFRAFFVSRETELCVAERKTYYNFVSRGTESMAKEYKIVQKLKKFGSKGEKTGWTYLEIENQLSEKLIPGKRTSYRVYLKIDGLSDVLEINTLPMGEGDFIIPLKSDILKKLKKKEGDQIQFTIRYNPNEYKLDKDFAEFIETDKKAKEFFESMPRSHQNYFSKWIETAKTPITKANRIAEAVQALSKKMNYAEMVRARKNIKL